MSPPNGRTLDRRTIVHRMRLADPFAMAVRSRTARSSSVVMCPTMLMCAPVARAGAVFVSADSSPRSHPSRTTAESVLPSRRMTAIARANSGSITISRLSLMPGSVSTRTRSA